jgi:hypothetical protein
MTVSLVSSIEGMESWDGGSRDKQEVSMDQDGTESESIPSALDKDLDRRTPIEIEFWV